MCDDNICPLLTRYMEDADREEIVNKLLKRKTITGSSVKRLAKKNDVCPFELSMDTALECDVVLGDYNYVFHPRVRLQRYFGYYYKDIILIVDEAHNLPSRASDYYSPTISLLEIKDVGDYLTHSFHSKELKPRRV